MEAIFADFEQTIVPGMTHWQHPRFFAYFPANAAPVSVVAEYLVSAMAAQCMLWQTSPAATELETRMIDWLRQALGLPEGFSGVIQDSASSATLAAVLTMRERALDWAGNRKGLAGQKRAARLLLRPGPHLDRPRDLGRRHRRGESGQHARQRAAARHGCGRARGGDRADRAAGLLPAGIIACVGGTSIGGTDDVAARRRGGASGTGSISMSMPPGPASAMICPEFRHFWAGVEQADSIVFNPHKWLGAQFDCSVQFVRDPESLVRTLAIKPEFLKTHGRDGIINYSEWSVPLGRRFRALKLWFLLRAHGLEGLAHHDPQPCRLERKARRTARARMPDFEIVTRADAVAVLVPPSGRRPASIRTSTICALVNAINDDGRIYLTQTRVDGRVAIRFQAGQFELERARRRHGLRRDHRDRRASLDR